MKPYEEPTNELRQVRHKSMLWNGDWYVFFVTQRKWLLYPGSVPNSCAAQWAKDKTKEEWRNLPVVDAKDIK